MSAVEPLVPGGPSPPTTPTRPVGKPPWPLVAGVAFLVFAPVFFFLAAIWIDPGGCDMGTPRCDAMDLVVWLLGVQVLVGLVLIVVGIFQKFRRSRAGSSPPARP